MVIGGADFHVPVPRSSTCKDATYLDQLRVSQKNIIKETVRALQRLNNWTFLQDSTTKQDNHQDNQQELSVTN